MFPLSGAMQTSSLTVEHVMRSSSADMLRQSAPMLPVTGSKQTVYLHKTVQEQGAGMKSEHTCSSINMQTYSTISKGKM